MNPYLLWIPGFALIVVGALLLALGHIGLVPAVALMGLGAVIESAGVLLWLRGRRERSTR